LYRDTNGWCPFCEKVWLALEEKQIPYDEVLINLQDKPDWYKAMIPTTLVPAIELHDDAYDGQRRGSGQLIYESADILKHLDEAFPETAQLRASEAVPEVAEAVLSTAFSFVYSSRNATLTAQDRSDRRTKFYAALDTLDGFLAGEGNGPFLNGASITAADIALLPMLERYRYQLPFLVPGEEPLLVNAGQPRLGLQAWFDALDSAPSFARRVGGDEYSWTATTSSFLRLFSANATDAETLAKVANADNAASALLSAAVGDVEALNDKAACEEAAAKLSTNFDYIVNDACNADPKTQKHLVRATGPNALDSARATVRAAQATLLGEKPDLLQVSAPVALYIASRLCAPRDMGRPAARALRHVLMAMATR